jgi:2'-5' RNA ligase
MALPETGRYFVALDLGPQVLGALGEAQGELRESGGPPMRWTRPEAMHLTLKFLGGSVPRSMAEGAVAAMGPALANSGPFELEVRGLGAFPSPKRARVLWAGIEDSGGALSALQSSIESEMAGLGPPTGEFHAHVTLGRLRDRRGRADLSGLIEPMAERSFGSVNVHEVVLYHSTLTPQGPRYEDVAREPL